MNNHTEATKHLMGYAVLIIENNWIFNKGSAYELIFERSMEGRISSTQANKTVYKKISSWEGISVHEHRFGGIEFRLGRRELGHLHPSFADLPFPRKVRDELVADGLARPHHILPDTGWVTVPMRTSSEVENVIFLFRRNYERIRTLS